LDGDLKEKELRCDGYTRCLIGRAEDCDIQLPTDFVHADISRHHCVLEVEPPHVRVRDLGSLNGTFVNGELIASVRRVNAAHVEAPPVCAERELEDGDQIRVGTVLLNLSISAPAMLSSRRISFDPVSGYFVRRGTARLSRRASSAAADFRVGE